VEERTSLNHSSKVEGARNRVERKNVKKKEGKEGTTQESKGEKQLEGEVSLSVPKKKKEGGKRIGVKIHWPLEKKKEESIFRERSKEKPKDHACHFTYNSGGGEKWKGESKDGGAI